MTTKINLAILATVTALASPPAWSAGGLDTTFGTHGQVIFGPEVQGSVAATQSDGKIVVVNNTVAPASSSRDLVVVRLLASGAADPSFGTAGRVQMTAVIGPGTSPAVHAVSVGPDGRILVSACTPARGADSGCVGALFRLNSDGSNDTTFGLNGLLYDPSSSGAVLEALAVQSDNQIIGIASAPSPASPGTGNDLLILRLTPTGALDASFGIAGITRVDWMQRDDNAVDVALQADGRILIAANVGDDRVMSYDQRTEMAVLRLLQDGKVDTGFADAGWWVYSPSEFGATTHRINVLQNDQIIVAAATESDSMDDYTFSFALGLSATGALNASYARPTSAQTLDSVWQLAGPTPLLALPDGSVWISSGGTESLLIGTLRPDGESAGSAPRLAAQTIDAGSLDSTHLNVLTATNVFAAAQNRFIISGTSTDTVTGQSVGFIARHRLDDPAAGTITLDASTQTETEVTLLVRRTGGSQGSVSVHFQTIDADALAGQDYSTATGQLDWADGDASDRQISVSVSSQAHMALNPLSFYVRLAPVIGDIALRASAVPVQIRTSQNAGGGNQTGGSSTHEQPGGGGGSTLFDLAALLSAFCLRRVWLLQVGVRTANSKGTPPGTFNCPHEFKVDPPLIALPKAQVTPLPTSLYFRST